MTDHGGEGHGGQGKHFCPEIFPNLVNLCDASELGAHLSVRYASGGGGGKTRDLHMIWPQFPSQLEIFAHAIVSGAKHMQDCKQTRMKHSQRRVYLTIDGHCLRRFPHLSHCIPALCLCHHLIVAIFRILEGIKTMSGGLDLSRLPIS